MHLYPHGSKQHAQSQASKANTDVEHHRSKRGHCSWAVRRTERVSLPCPHLILSTIWGRGLLGCCSGLHMICRALRRTFYSNIEGRGLLGCCSGLHMICGALRRTFYSNIEGRGLLGCCSSLHMICGALRRTFYSNTDSVGA